MYKFTEKILVWANKMRDFDAFAAGGKRGVSMLGDDVIGGGGLDMTDV